MCCVSGRDRDNHSEPPSSRQWSNAGHGWQKWGRAPEGSSEGRQRWEPRYAQGDRDTGFSPTQEKPNPRFHNDQISSSCLTPSFPGFMSVNLHSPQNPQQDSVQET